jgi:integrase/recombinase XerD
VPRDLTYQRHLSDADRFDIRKVGFSSPLGGRYFITKLAYRGVSVRVRVLMALAGHKSIATTQRYIELNPTIMRGEVELI